MPGYERLSALDETFLAFETPSTYMHVALVTTFGPGSVAGEKGLKIERVRKYFESRLHLVPRYRQKLRLVPLTGDAVWVDDEDFDLDYHVRHASLPRPGTKKQLQRRCAEILERPLDRKRPLWESWFIEGLRGGRFAMITKVHHCMVDGIAGVEILAALLSLEPVKTVKRAAPWGPCKAPTDREMLGDEVARRVTSSVGLVRDVGSFAARATRDEVGKRVGALFGLFRAGGTSFERVAFNERIGPHRRIAWTETRIEEILRIKRALGGSLNDVVLATVAGALRAFMLGRGDTVTSPYRVIVPVSVRSGDEKDKAGNRVSAWIVDLPVDERGAARRYSRTVQMTEALKRDETQLGAQMLAQAAELTTGSILGLGARLLSQSHLFNLIVTNVPGPRVPLYLLDSPMLEAYPHVPLFADQGVGIALFSYGENLYWGIAADWDLVPDIEDLGAHVGTSFAELLQMASRPKRRVRVMSGRIRAVSAG